jgi:hypothetical protein
MYQQSVCIEDEDVRVTRICPWWATVDTYRRRHSVGSSSKLSRYTILVLRWMLKLCRDSNFVHLIILMPNEPLIAVDFPFSIVIIGSWCVFSEPFRWTHRGGSPIILWRWIIFIQWNSQILVVIQFVINDPLKMRIGSIGNLAIFFIPLESSKSIVAPPSLTSVGAKCPVAIELYPHLMFIASITSSRCNANRFQSYPSLVGSSCRGVKTCTFFPMVCSIHWSPRTP